MNQGDLYFKRLSIAGMLVLLSEFLYAQDSSYSQFFANPLHLNPAYAGTTELPRLVLNYRNQWPQKGATYTTYAVSYDQLIRKKNAGLGIQMTRDQELNNVINHHSASAAYSYHLKLGDESFLTLGLKGGMVLKQFNVNNLVFPSGINQLTGEISEFTLAGYSDKKKLYPDFAAGAVGQHGDF